MWRLIFSMLIIVLRLCQMLKGNWAGSMQDPLDHFCKSSVYSCMLSRFSRVQLFATPWTIALQAPLSMGFSRQEYCSGLPCPPPGDLPNPGIELASLPSPALAGMFFITRATWEAHSSVSITPFFKKCCCDSKWPSTTGNVDQYFGKQVNKTTLLLWERKSLLLWRSCQETLTNIRRS